MKLHENLWRPKTWETENHHNVPREQISQDGILETCEVTNQGLMIEVDYRDKKVFDRVASPSFNSPGNLYKLRDFLLDHSGASMTTIENLDFDRHQFDR